MSNPNALSRKRSLYGTSLDEQVGQSSISFPFTVEGKNGENYGFIYRSDGLLDVYKKEKGHWKEFSRLEIHTVN